MSGFANFITQQESDVWPAGPASTKTSVGIASLSIADQIEVRKKEGWRKIRTRQLPNAGFRIIKTVIVDNKDGETCDVNIVPPQMSILAEQTAQDAANAKATEDRRKAMIDYLCQGEVTRLFVALHNAFLDKPISEEAVRAEAEKILA